MFLGMVLTMIGIGWAVPWWPVCEFSRWVVTGSMSWLPTRITPEVLSAD
jgi:hypothetical protein